MKRYVVHIGVCIVTFFISSCNEKVQFTDQLSGISVSKPELEGNSSILKIRNSTETRYCIFTNGASYGEDFIEGNAPGFELTPAIGPYTIGDLRFWNNGDAGNVVEIERGLQEVQIGPFDQLPGEDFEIMIPIFECQPDGNGLHYTLIYVWSR